MAKGFKSVKGEYQKGGEYYKWKDGEQTLRLVGDIVCRYVYWKKTPDGKNIAFECLGFDRDLEKFTNIEKDWFQTMFPEQKCSWSYVARAIHPDDEAKTILVPLKKKLYQQIQEVAEDLGDPTDIDTGWDCIVMRTVTGAHAFNVEYSLKQLKCKTRELNPVERAAVAEMPDIDSLVPRQTPEDQRAQINQLFFSADDQTEVDTNSTETFDDVPQ